MKNIKISVLALFIVAGYTMQATAQSAEATASATIVEELTIEKAAGTDIRFGNLSATTPSAVINSPIVTNNQNVAPRAETDLARFDVKGADEAKIIFTYSLSVDMISGSNSITMTPLVYGSTGSFGALAAGNAIGNASGEVELSEDGEFTVWVGGSLPVLDGQTPGEYTGTFSIQVAYN